MFEIKFKINGELYAKLIGIAESREVTLVELIRKFVKLGLLVDAIEKDPDTTLIVEEKGQRRVLILN